MQVFIKWSNRNLAFVGICYPQIKRTVYLLLASCSGSLKFGSVLALISCSFTQSIESNSWIIAYENRLCPLLCISLAMIIHSDTHAQSTLYNVCIEKTSRGACVLRRTLYHDYVTLALH
jgi:hypothetical protein